MSGVRTKRTYSQGMWTDLHQLTRKEEISISEKPMWAVHSDHGPRLHSPSSQTWNPKCPQRHMASRKGGDPGLTT